VNFANITGWGKYVPPLCMSNDELAKIVDTTDEWIFSRSGIRQRYFSHVSTGEMAWLAAERALATAGVMAEEIDLIVLGSTTPEEMCPNTASFIKNKLGATKAACFDLNSACTSWFYGLNAASDMIKAGSISKAIVIGAERLSLALDWNKRESCFLFGDGAAAVVLESCEKASGLIAAQLSCVPDTRNCLRLPSWGMSPLHFTDELFVSLDFDGQEIFKNAVKSMEEDCKKVLEKACLTIADVDFIIPHQANIRSIKALAKRLDFPIEKIMVVIDRYANTSAASIPLALCDAIEQGGIQPGMVILTCTFGAGLSCGAGIIKWGDKLLPTAVSNKAITPFNGSVFDLMANSFTHYGIDAKHLLTPLLA